MRWTFVSIPARLLGGCKITHLKPDYRQVKKTYFEEPVEKPVTSVKPTYHSWLDSSYRIYRHEDYQERQWTYLRKHVLRRTKTPQPSTKEFCYYPRCTARNLDSEPTFHPWSRLPTELKILILEHALRESIGRLRRSPQYHQSFVLRAWATFINCNVHVLGAILGTRNHELVELVLDACESQARQCQQPAYLRSAYYSQVRMTYLENPLVLIALAKGQGYDRADLRWWDTLRALTARRLGNPHTSTAEPQV